MNPMNRTYKDTILPLVDSTSKVLKGRIMWDLAECSASAVKITQGGPKNFR